MARLGLSKAQSGLPDATIVRGGRMAVRVGMPNLGHTMEFGKVVEWLKPIGVPVAKGDQIAVVESDKVSMEVEAPVDGVILQHSVALNVDVEVGGTIARIGAPGETVTQDEPARPSAPVIAPAEKGVPAASGGVAPGGRINASPVSRRLAEQLGVDLATIRGTGPGGAITKADVEGAAKADTSGHRVIPLAGNRQKIADRLSQAWREIPMVPLSLSADVTAVHAERSARGGPTWTALIARALALTLPAYPRVNALFHDGRITECADVDLSIAVALPDDLAVPVLRAAQSKSLREIADETTALGSAARAGTLARDGQGGGTFTLSNLGGTGIDQFQPIINPPQVAILGVGRVRAFRDGSGMRHEATLTLVFDHRAMDGFVGAQFLAALAATLRDPARLWSE